MPIRARFSAAAEYAGVRVTPDNLTAPEARAVQSAYHLVTLSVQGLCQVVGEGWLDMESVAANPLPARCVQRGLGVMVKVKAVHEHLHMCLGLHKATHHTERTHGLFLVRQEAGDDGVVGPLAPGEGVNVPLVQSEAIAAVLQRNARAGDDNARAKAHVVALDVAHHIPFAIGCRQVDRASPLGDERLRGVGPGGDA